QTPTAAFTVNASGAPGDYTFQVLGTGRDPDNLQRSSGTATLHVIDLSLTNPAAITTSSNTTSAASPFTATTAGTTFPASSVALSCGGLPAGASCSFTPGNTFSPTPTGVHNLTVAVM